jgi:hypothetical protein
MPGGRPDGLLAGNGPRRLAATWLERPKQAGRLAAVIAAEESMELRGRFLLGGEPGDLYAISSTYDDYIELALPPDQDLASAARSALERLPGEIDGCPIDVKFLDGERVTACVLVLYVSAPQQRDRPHRRRLEAILRHLTLAVPSLDFGDLLPQGSLAPEVAAAHPGVERAGEPLIVALPVPPPSTGPHPSPRRNGSSPHAQNHPEQVGANATGPATAASSPAQRANGSHRLDANGSHLREAGTQLERARSLAARGQMHKAQRVAEGVAATCPGHPGAVDLLQQLKLLERRAKRRSREPGNAQAQLEAGFSYLLLNCNREAIKPLEQAGRISPGLYLAHLLLGIAHHRQGDASAARTAYQKAARLRSNQALHDDLLAALVRGEPPVPLVEA